MPPLSDASSSRERGRRGCLKVGVGSKPASAASIQPPPPLINALPRDQSADEEAVNARVVGGTTISPLRDASSRDGPWTRPPLPPRGGHDYEEEGGRGRARSSSDGLPLLPLGAASAFKSDAAISWRPCRARLKAVQEKGKQNKFRGGVLKVDHGVERERRRQERTERRCFGAMSVVLRYLTLVTLVTQMGSAVEGVGVAHRSLLNTGNPDAKRLYDDLLSNYNR